MNNLLSTARQLKDTLRTKQLDASVELYTRYLSELSEARGRAVRCCTLIDKGHFTAALYFARAHSDLLELFRNWPREDHEKVGRAVAYVGDDSHEYIPDHYERKLLAAEELEKRTASVLAEYRASALIQADARDRLFRLQKLRQADPKNQPWIDDAEYLEPSRLEQIQQESAEALDRIDEEKLQALAKEMQLPWHSKQSVEVREKVNGNLKFVQERRAAPRRYVAIGVVSAIALGLVGLIGWNIYAGWRLDFQGEIASEEMSLFIEQERVLAARQWYDELEKEHPDVAATPAIQVVLTKLKVAEAQFAVRHQEFLLELGRLRTLPVDRLTATDINELETKVQSGSDKADVFALRESLQKHLTNQARQRVLTYEAKLTPYDVQIAKWEVTPGQLLPEAAELDAMTDELTSLRDEASSIPGATMTKLDELVSRIAEVRDLIDHRQREIAALDRIALAIGNRAEFVAELTQYADQFPGSRSDSFRQVLGEEPIWNGWEPWSHAVAAWNSKVEGGLDFTSSTRLAALIDRANQAASTHPAVVEFERIRPYIEATSRQSSDIDSPTLKSVNRLFTSYYFTDLTVVVTSDGKRYYTKAKLQWDEAKPTIPVEYISALHADAFKTVEIDTAYAVHKVAPQTELSRSFPKHVARLPDMAWDDWFLNLIQGVASQREIDPLVRVIMLRRIISVGCQGSEPLNRVLKYHLDQIQAPGLHFQANWIDPDDTDAQQAREIAWQRLEIFIKAMPQFPLRVAQAKQQILRRINIPTQWIGCLIQESNSGWTCRLREASLPPTGKLYVLVPEPTAGSCRYDLIGQITQGRVNILATASAALVEGRPVFADPTPEPTVARAAE